MPSLGYAILRIIYFAFVLYLGAFLGIAVAMGFDAGASIFAITVACAYLFTFVPALILGFVPLNIVTSPPKLLKLWYWWIAFLGVLFVGYQIVIGFANLLTSQASSYGKVCFQVKDNEKDKTEAWIDVASPQIAFHRFRQVPVDKNAWCSNFGLGLSPIRVKAYSVTDKNRKSPKATEEDDSSKVLTVVVMAEKTVCVAISPIGNSTTGSDYWRVQEVPCDR